MTRTLFAFRSGIELDDYQLSPLIRALGMPRANLLIAAFASWAADHAASSVPRAHSPWSSLFDFLVAEDLVDGNPMAAIGKPRLAPSAPKAIKADDAAQRLLTSAATVDRPPSLAVRRRRRPPGTSHRLNASPRWVWSRCLEGGAAHRRRALSVPY